MSSIHFESAKGRAVLKYPNEVMAQEQYVDVCNDGTIYFSANPEVGNAIPVKVWDGHIRRISFNRSISETMTKVMRKQFYNDNKKLFQQIVDGMGEKFDGNTYKGTLTEDAQHAEDQLSFNAENFYGE